jgi:hypothetical protein
LLDETGCSWNIRDSVASIQLARGSVKKCAAATRSIRTMNAVVAAGSEIAAALTRWYADHASIRRLWAIDAAPALTILVALEPTSDGDDTLPVWLANYRSWASDLRLLVQRDVQLQLVVPGTFGEALVDPDAVTIAEVSWRDAWMTS